MNKEENNYVELTNRDFYWPIYVRFERLDTYSDRTEKIYQLSWGWFPFGEVPENIAEDSPKGHESIFTTEGMLRKLKDQINDLLEEKTT